MNPKPIKFSPPEQEAALSINRRHFLSRTSLGIGGAALAALLPGCLPGTSTNGLAPSSMLPGLHLPAKAKRVIYLFQSGGPAQMDLFDYKAGMAKMHGEELPGSIRMGKRLTGMTSNQ